MIQTLAERALADCQAAEGESPDGPRLVMGVHKGGSTLLMDFIQTYCWKRVRAFSLPDWLFKRNVADASWEGDSSLIEVLGSPCVQYGFRFVPLFMLVNKAMLSQFPAVLMVRDPRDCVVSAYFSFLASHRMPEAGPGEASVRETATGVILEERARFAGTSIDTYCLEAFDQFVTELHRVSLFLHPNVRLYRYEDVIFDKRPFFEDVLDWLQLPMNAERFEHALNVVDKVPEMEDPAKHIRAVTPGDHRRKLKSETIRALTQRSAALLELFGYEQ